MIAAHSNGDEAIACALVVHKLVRTCCIGTSSSSAHTAKMPVSSSQYLDGTSIFHSIYEMRYSQNKSLEMRSHPYEIVRCTSHCLEVDRQVYAVDLTVDLVIM